VRVRFIIFSLVIVCCPCRYSFAQSAILTKSWKFGGKNGDLQITARSFTTDSKERVTRLEISPTVRDSWTLEAEAASLEEVLNDFTNAGFDIMRLESISLRLNEKSAQSCIAIYAAESHSWRAALKTRSVGKVYPLIVAYLNECHAYAEFDRVLREKGLRLKVVGVEEVIMAPFSQLGAKCPANRSCAGLLIPTDALVQLNVEPIDAR
jgi:hypothetical protein